ncbi:diaminopimelate epimerase [Altererythrobacter atlanticus]|uniref:Diaminopimelate epimerase n=1 Tax=Croceibacterium atlanticum TaxID=1267766 RepID=A0A0F7KQK3_9SPHN|nr:diaminopimelate epimerase [Croceibacterium atlanticum]AKH41864.1 Diaminopimelate epimerase [Croceibacterium atlanticum]MBB5733573.1 diaminopimelate epimerase [Croceibacterium atlanticum]
MRASFVKMHGLGNDFVVLDAREKALPPITAGLARALADRRTGIGCDQLVLLQPSAVADFRMRIFNSDGSEVGACGNASRAVALLHGAPATVETGGGTIEVRPSQGGAAVDMGEPHFGWDEIPLAYAMDTMALPVGWEELSNPVAVNVGNPHAIFFVPNCEKVDLEELGPMIERDAIFPERVNVNVATVDSRDSIRLRVWERGAGLTRACGTGACATAVAAMRRGFADRSVTVTLPGGPLHIEWGEDNRITMTGPATESFRGSFDWGDFA